jgi:hypothetical protein
MSEPHGRGAPRASGELEVEQDLAFQGVSWRVQRIGWAALAVLVVAALLGAFGDGVLSRAAIGDPSSALHLSYERFARHGSPTRLQLTWPGARGTGSAALTVDSEYLRAVSLEQVIPEPERVVVGDAGVTLRFPAVADARRTTVVLVVRPRRIGRTGGVVRVEGHPDIRFRQLIYP